MIKSNLQNKPFYLQDATVFGIWDYSIDDYGTIIDFSSLIDANNRFGSDKISREFLKFFESNNITLHEFHLKDDVDINKLDLPREDADHWDFLGGDVKKIFLDTAEEIKQGNYGGKDFLMVASFYGFLGKGFYTQKSMSEKESNQVRNGLDKYIKKFIDGELLIHDVNFLRFERQRDFFKKLLSDQKCLEKYGTSFVLYYSLEVEQKADGFLFFHTLYALEFLGYIEAFNLKTHYENQEIILSATVTVFDKLREEIDSDYQDKNPKSTIESFDASKGILKFAGKNIELAKKGKETDAVMLVSSLIGVPKGEYKHEDEILAEWDPTGAYGEKGVVNKVYYAARGVNELVLKETKQVDDFLEHGTKKFRINPRYLKNG